MKSPYNLRLLHHCNVYQENHNELLSWTVCHPANYTHLTVSMGGGLPYHDEVIMLLQQPAQLM